MKTTSSDSASKLTYHAPELKAYGSITKLTLNANNQLGPPDDSNKGNSVKNSAIN